MSGEIRTQNSAMHAAFQDYTFIDDPLLKEHVFSVMDETANPITLGGMDNRVVTDEPSNCLCRLIDCIKRIFQKLLHWICMTCSYGYRERFNCAAEKITLANSQVKEAASITIQTWLRAVWVKQAYKTHCEKLADIQNQLKEERDNQENPQTQRIAELEQQWEKVVTDISKGRTEADDEDAPQGGGGLIEIQSAPVKHVQNPVEISSAGKDTDQKIITQSTSAITGSIQTSRLTPLGQMEATLNEKKLTRVSEMMLLLLGKGDPENVLSWTVDEKTRSFELKLKRPVRVYVPTGIEKGSVFFLIGVKDKAVTGHWVDSLQDFETKHATFYATMIELKNDERNQHLPEQLTPSDVKGLVFTSGMFIYAEDTLLNVVDLQYEVKFFMQMTRTQVMIAYGLSFPLKDRGFAQSIVNYRSEWKKAEIVEIDT